MCQLLRISPDCVTRLAHDREQNRRLLAPVSGQNAHPHCAHTTTVPFLPWPGRARLAARPAGDMPTSLRRRAALAAAGSHSAMNRALSGYLRRALSAIMSRVALATNPRLRDRP